MTWQTQLITLYLTVCEHYRNGLWTTVQRFSPYSDLSFSDEEVITIYLFGIMDKQRDIKSIYTQTQCYLQDWFPKLPSYTAYILRLNQLASIFPSLCESFCPEQNTVSFAGLVDSFPIVMAHGVIERKLLPNMPVVGIVRVSSSIITALNFICLATVVLARCPCLDSWD